MKEKLLQAQAETREREADLVAMVKDGPPDPSGKWRPQDHLAHLSEQRRFGALVFDAVRTGGDPPPDPGEGSNDAFYEATKDQPAAAVVAGADRTWVALETAIGACTEHDLAQPNPYGPNPRRLGDGAPGDHLAAHLFWCYLDAGDEKSAEAILRWAQDLSSRTSTDARTHAVGTYNLACFYARTGRADQAIPLLRDSFERAPDLKDWAHKDPDLDPIRDDPTFIRLLGEGEAARGRS